MMNRRNFISLSSLGAAGVALLPFVERMRAAAAGNISQLPKRFVFFTTANGIDSGYLFPEVEADKKGSTLQKFAQGGTSEVEQIVDRRLAEVGLGPWMDSLAPVIEKTTCITGLSGKMCRGQHSVGFGTLGAQSSGQKGAPKMETIDGAFAKLLPSIFSHIGVSANRGGSVSATGPGSVLPLYSDPIEVYDQLFGVISNDPRAQVRNRFDGKLLDFMVDDVKTFQKRLPGEERGQLAHYLNAYEQMSVRHGQLLAKEAKLEKIGAKRPGSGLSWEDRVEAHCDLITNAMIAGLTNVAAINTDGNGEWGAMYGARSGFEETTGGHGFGHGPSHRRVLPFGFNISMMAKMARTLDAVPEGDGTMLDNTVLLMVSTSGSTHHCHAKNFPMVLIGNCNGRMRMGRHLQIPGYEKSENSTIGTMYTTLLHAAGFPRDGFGEIDGSTTRANQLNPLAELLV